MPSRVVFILTQFFYSDSLALPYFNSIDFSARDPKKFAQALFDANKVDNSIFKWIYFMSQCVSEQGLDGAYGRCFIRFKNFNSYYVLVIPSKLCYVSNG